MKRLSVITSNIILEELRNFPLQAVIWGILEKNNIGSIFELPGGSVLIMEDSDDPFAFLVGPITSVAVEEAITIAANASYPMIYCHPRYHHLFLEKNWDFHLRA